MARHKRTVLLVICCLLAANVQHAGADERARIWKEFAKRHAEAETVRVTWNQSLTLPSNRFHRSRDSGPNDRQEKDRVFDAHPASLILSGDRVRYECFIASQVEERRNRLIPSIATFDGKVGRSLTLPGLPQEAYGGEEPLRKFDEWGNVHLRAIVMAIRPLRPDMFGPETDGWEIVEQPAVIDGTSCVVMRKRLPTSRSRTRIYDVYLDPQRNYVPLRYQSMAPGQPTVQVDIQYDRTAEPFWAPSSWTAGFYLGGTPSSQSGNVLKSIELGLAVPDETFTIDFPVGAEVTVMQPPAPDGQLRFQRFVIGEDTAKIPQRQAIAQTTSVPAAASATTSRGWMIISAVGCAALGVALLLWWRTRTTG